MPLRTLLVIVAAAALRAQNISAGMSGTVTDSTDAPIPAVTVVASESRTGFTRSVTTNEQGFFAFPDLTPGSYQIVIEHAGFKKYTQKEIALNSGDQRTLGRLRLQVGENKEAITVTAEAAQVQLGSSEKSSSLTQEEIQNLALRGRDIMDAIALMPGVVDTTEGRDAPSQTSIGGISLAGGRDNSKNFAIDGVTSMDTGSNGSVHSMPSMDSIGEVRVLLSNYAAEFGRNSGGAITVITRGGGKQFHGSAGWYNRHESYMANNWLNNQRGLSRAPYRYNIASYTVSGPVFVPKLFNRERKKLYFFWSQEFQEQRKDYGSRTVTVPTAAERQGDFSNSRNTNGALRIVRDPLTPRVNNNKQQFPGNIIPASRMDPNGAKILGLFPLPNFVDPNPSRLWQWNYIANESGSYPRRTEILRLDYAPVQKLQMNLRVSNTADQQEAPWGIWVNGSVNFPLTPIVFRQPGRGATFRATSTISPTIFNEFTAGVSQNRLWYYPRDPQKVSRKALGLNLPQWNPGLNDGDYIPNLNFSQVQNWANPSMSDGVPYDNANLIWALTDNLSKIWRTHQIKIGFYFEKTRKDQSANAATRGTLNFNNNTLSEYDTGFAYANAFIGSFNSYTESSARPRGNYFFHNFEFYVQDAWRVKPRLLIDYGVRFYANPPTYDRGMQLYTFSPSAYNPANAPVLLRPALTSTGQTIALDPVTGKQYGEGYIGLYAPGVGNPAEGMVRAGSNGLPAGLYSIPPVMAAPRIGFSWDPRGRGRTAIRGGAGVYFDRIQGNMTYNMLPNPPSIFSPTVYYGTLKDLAETSGKGVLAPSGTVRAIFGDNPMPTTYNYSLGVQQQFGRSMLLDVSYVGSISRHQLWQRNINPIPLGAQLLDVSPQNVNPARPGNVLPGNFLRPIQGYADIFLYEFAATSNYNSVQARLTQRLGKNINWGVSYTFSKALGTASNDGVTVSTFFSPREYNYGPLAHDRSQVLAINYSWRMPFRRNALVKGWQLSGITRGQTGAPFMPGFTIVNGGQTSGSDSQAARLVVVNPQGPETDRFRAPGRGEVGNLGFNTMRQPGFLNFDISMYRDLKFTERLTATLRFETYNTFNHTQYSGVSTGTRWETVGSTVQTDPLFLEPISARPPRIIQFALQLRW